MNKCEFIGNLTKDPELSETSNGTKLCRFSIAVNRSYKSADGERKTDFYNCIAWRGLAELIAEHLKKGNKIYVCGELEQRTYEDANKIKRTAYELSVRDVEFLTPKSNASDEAVQAKLQPTNDDTDIPF